MKAKFLGVAALLLCANGSFAAPVDLVQRFDFSNSPVTLVPVDHSISPQTYF